MILLFFYKNEYNQCETLFKGLKILTNEISDIKRDSNGVITKIISDNQGRYDGYKFSIMLSDVYFEEYGTPYNVNGVTNYDSIMNIIDDGIHVIVNDIYKNILVIINIGITIPNNNGETFNYVTLFGEKDGLYDNKYRDGSIASSNYNSRKLVASNFINAINFPNEKYGFDNFIKYYNIRKENGVTVVSDTFINGENIITNPPLVLTVGNPDPIKIKDNSFKVEIVDTPNIGKLFGKDSILKRTENEKNVLTVKLIQDDTITSTKEIYRYSGSYEPIFKDIDLYQESIFCYTDYISGTTTGITTGTNNTTNAKSYGIRLDDHIDPDIKKWADTMYICSDTTRTTYTYMSLPRTDKFSEFDSDYLICSNFNFNIPLDSTISGVTITINRKSHIVPTISRYVKDHTVSFINNAEYVGTPNSGVTIISGFTDSWGTGYTSVVYGYNDSTPAWVDSTTWTPSLVNSSNFGVLVRCSVLNDPGSHPDPIIWDVMPDIKCVTVAIRFISGSIWDEYSNSIYFDKNLKFDDTLYKFGTIDEVINSKVNIENKKILKFEDAKYPKVDQFGYSNSNRFIFKSDWDKDFYLNTTDNFVDDSTTFAVRTTKTKINK